MHIIKQSKKTFLKGESLNGFFLEKLELVNSKEKQFEWLRNNVYKNLELIKTMFSEKFKYFNMVASKSTYEKSDWRQVTGKAIAILVQWWVKKTLYLRQWTNQN